VIRRGRAEHTRRPQDIRDKTAHLRPLHDAVQAEFMRTVLRSPNSLIPKRVEANGARFAILSFFLLFLFFIIDFAILKSER